MAHDVFVSHSSKDKTTADAVVATLEAAGIRCWVAPRDVVPGRDWGTSIIEAIQNAKVMLVILSGHANRSTHILREVERAVNRGVTVVPMRIEDVVPSDALEYFLSSPHWLDAFSPPFEQHLKRLAVVIRNFLGVSEVPPEEKSTDKSVGGKTSIRDDSNESPNSAKWPWFMGIALALGLCLAVASYYFYYLPASKQRDQILMTMGVISQDSRPDDVYLVWRQVDAYLHAGGSSYVRELWNQKLDTWRRTHFDDITWSLPAGWTRKFSKGMGDENSEISVLHFTIDKDSGELDIEADEASSKDLLSLVNDDRETIGATDIGAADLNSQVAYVKSAGGWNIAVWEISGPQGHHITAFLRLPKSTWYFTLRGDSAGLTNDKPAFLQLLASVRPAEAQ